MVLGAFAFSICTPAHTIHSTIEFNDTSTSTTQTDSFEVYTFFDSQTWGFFYGYNQIIIILTILISSYFLAKEIKLYFQCYKFLKNIYSNLAYICIAINGLKKKYKYKDDISKIKSYNKVKNITIEMVIDVIDSKCDEIHQLVDCIKNYFKTRVSKMIEKEMKKGKDFNSILLTKETKVSDETVATGIQLSSPSTKNDNTEIKMIETTIVFDNEMENKQDIRLNGTESTKTTQTVTKKVLANGLCEEHELHKKKDNGERLSVVDEVISEYVSSEICKYDLSSNKKDGFRKFCGIVWDIHKIMFMTFSHIFDTASDVALAVEWYILYMKQLNDKTFFKKYNIDMETMFFCCISVILYYRIISSWQIYKFSHSFKDVFLQFLFDFYLIKLIYVNVFKMKSYSPLKYLKIIRSCEGSNESGFQAILTMVFLIKTNFGEFGTRNNSSSSYSANIAILSFIFSFWSLTSRFIFLDSIHLKTNAQTLGINVNSFKLSEINIWYIFHLLFRLIEVLFSILMISLIWVIFGGEWIVIIVFVLYLWLMIIDKFEGRPIRVLRGNLLTHLMIFDIVRITVAFNLPRFNPYIRLNTRFAQLSLFTCLGLWIWLMRILLCIIIVTLYDFDKFGNGDNLHNDATSFCVIFAIGLIFVWFLMLICSIKYYINRDFHIAMQQNNYLSGIDAIKVNDEESIIFCKELGIDVFRHYNSKNKSKYDTAYNIANNVLDAMLMSNEIANYSIIQEWYYDIGMKKKMGCDFEHFLTQWLEWNADTIRRLVANCDSLDYYILIHDKLRFDLSLIDDVKKKNILHRAIYYGRDSAIIEWILNNNIIIDINSVDKYGETCLHYLINYIIDNNKQNKSDLTNEKKIAQLLILHGVDVNIEERNGETAKQFLREYGLQDELYRWLVDDEQRAD